MLEIIRDALVPYAAGGYNKANDERRALDYFRENPTGTVSGLSAALGMPQRSVERLVARLKEDGKLIRNGSPRSGSWTVAP